MKLFVGFLIGLVIAAAIAATALKVAWGDLDDIGARDKSADISKTIEAADFDRIEVAGAFELDVSVGGDAYSVTLTGKESDLARTTASVVDGELVLDTKQRDANGKRKFVKHTVTATISLPALNAIDATGVVAGAARGIDAEAFEVDISGVGDLSLSGRCGALDVDVSGVGELNAERLECRAVTVDVSGVGEATVFASESVDAEIAGVGRIEVEGSPASVKKSQSSPLGRISVN